MLWCGDGRYGLSGSGASGFGRRARIDATNCALPASADCAIPSMILLAEGLGGGGGSAFLAESFTAISTRFRTASSCPRHFRSSVEAVSPSASTPLPATISPPS